MAWLTGWLYGSEHSIAGTVDGILTDYQIGIKVYFGSGTDGTEVVGGTTFGTFYCSSLCKTDFGDIRFTDSDGTTLLSYWIQEKIDSNYAIIWVKVPLIPASPSTTNIFIYYGNASATSLSNGENTFLFWDDFSGDLSKWTVVNGSWQIVSGELRATSYNVAPQVVPIFIKVNIGTGNYSAYCQMKMSSVWEGKLIYNIIENKGRLDLMRYDKSGSPRIRQYDGTIHQSSYSFSTTDWYDVETTLYGTAYKAWLNNVLKFNLTVSYISDGFLMLGVYGEGSGLTGYFDNVRVRKYILPEPTHGTWTPVPAPPTDYDVYRDTNYKIDIDVAGSVSTLNATSFDCSVEYVGEANAHYGSRIKSHSAGSKIVKFTLTRMFYDGGSNEALLIGLFRDETEFDFDTYIVDKDGVSKNLVTLSFDNCRIYGWKQVTGAPDDIIGEQITGYATDFSYTNPP